MDLSIFVRLGLGINWFTDSFVVTQIQNMVELVVSIYYTFRYCVFI